MPKTSKKREKTASIRCPKCGHCLSEVIRTQAASDHITRRRECLTCRGRFTTVERIPGSTATGDGLRQLAIGHIADGLRMLQDSPSALLET